MSTTLTLGTLRQNIGVNLGEEDNTGTITTAIPSATVTDKNRNDLDNTWNMGYLQDTTIPGGSIARINTWSQSINQFALFQNLSGLAAINDSYEVHKVLSFKELNTAINRGISECGQGLRTLIRDESQVLVAGTYQYTPNYDATLPNAFFPGGVVQIQVEWDVGQPTAPWLDITGWEYLDDKVIQMTYQDADYYAGNQIRFTGYGPITTRVTTTDPAFVIGTFDDDFLVDSLVWACTYHAWLIAASKKSSNENQEELQMAQVAKGVFEESKKKWYRGQPFKRRIKVPTPPGWSGSIYT